MLKYTLIKALDGEERAVNRLCNEFRRISVAYLRTKANTNTFLLDHLYKNIDDLALDCIADLFGRQDHCFKGIEDFISREEAEKLSESQIEVKIRQLIFSKVNDGLYRNYKKLDPSLSRIIRNLKRTLDEDKVSRASYDANTGEILTGNVEKKLPNISDEILEIKLSSRYAEINNSVDAVQSLVEILDESEAYAPRFKLINYAVILRKVSAYRLENEEEQDQDHPGKKHDNETLKKTLRQCINEEKKHLTKTYVLSDKLSREQLDKYLMAIEDIIIADFICEMPREGYFEHVEFHFPELTYDRYRADHRPIVEYITKKLRGRFLSQIRKQENFSRS